MTAPIDAAAYGAADAAAGWIEPLRAPLAWPGRPLRFARLDRACRLAVLAAADALQDAEPPPAGPRSGIVIGTACGAHLTNELFFSSVRAESASPALFAYTLDGSPAAELSISLGLQGAMLALAEGVGAGLSAVAQAAHWLMAGRADWMLAGAVDTLGATLLRSDLSSGAAPLAESAALFTMTTERPGAVALVAGAGHASGARALDRAAAEALQRSAIGADELATRCTWPVSGTDAAPPLPLQTPLDLLAAVGQTLSAGPVLALGLAIARGALPALIATLDTDGHAEALCVGAVDD